jgi:hypothetical protein
MQAETKFAKKVDADLKLLRNGYFFNIQQVALRGTSDRLGVINGLFVALELKSSKKARRPKLQDYKLWKIRESGGFAEFVYPGSWKRVYNILREIDHGSRVSTLQKIIPGYKDRGLEV